jgi:hypothetical protein
MLAKLKDSFKAPAAALMISTAAFSFGAQAENNNESQNAQAQTVALEQINVPMNQAFGIGVRAIKCFCICTIKRCTSIGVFW